MDASIENAEDQSSSTSSKPRPQFGNRRLTNPEQVFQHNAWDDVLWTEELETKAQEKVAMNTMETVAKEVFDKYDDDANTYWDVFYNTHQDRFFKDRHWLFTEFPELAEILNLEGSIKTEGMGINNEKQILEVGCGVGNTVIPLLEANVNPNVFIYGCDFSEVAINILKNHSSYNPSRCLAFVCDITSENWSPPFAENSLDTIILIFVLSAVNPDKFQVVMKQMFKYLKPGGLILFRDYGRYDLAQLRFKKGACLGENFYKRGDGTRSYFFTENEVHDMFSDVGLLKETLFVDRRLQVNRGKQLKMYRIWVQAKYRKPEECL